MIYQFQPDYPAVQRDPAAISLIQPPFLGLDLEWDIHYDKPTILGVSDGSTTVSVPFDEGYPHLQALLAAHQDRFFLAGHNVVRAERPIFSRRGITFPLEKVQDSIIWHYLVNAHLCKAGGKAIGEDGEGSVSRRGPGFMNLGTMCSIHTSLPVWKYCHEKECHGVPCPKHDVFGYNGLDALGPVLALPDMQRKAKLLGVDKLYPLHVELNAQFQRMNERGVWVNTDYVDQMRADFREKKLVMWGEDQKVPNPTSLPFNPRSHQQVKKFFREKYDLIIPDTEEETIRYLVADTSKDREDQDLVQDEEGNFELKADVEGHPIPELVDLLTYKELGSGPDRWFAPKVWSGKDWDGYVVAQGGGYGTIHPSLNHFTSTGRTACSNPNLQNIEKRRIDRKTGENIGKRMRRAIVAPPDHWLYSADYSNGENRVFLYEAGYQIPDDQDLHAWMVQNIGLKDDDPFSILMGGAREASKSVTHAQDYLEGLDLLSPQKLRSSYVQREIKAGARRVFLDWKFRDMVVSFTGSNLAMRAFHSKDWDSRKRALEIGARYLDETFPKLRNVQRAITKQVESGLIRVPHGYVLRSYDRTPNDMVKTAAAMHGSNPVAHYLKLSLLNLENHPNLTPVLPVHDEHLVYADKRFEPTQVAKWIRDAMIFETPEMPGFHMPIKVKYGTDWAKMNTISL